MKWMKLITVMVLCAVFAQCGKNPVASDVRELTRLEKQIVDADNKFGFKLFKELVEQNENENVFISPLSVSMVLGMTLNGAAGETKSAMEQTLEFAGLSSDDINRSYQSLMQLLVQLDPRVAFQIANSIWYRQGFGFEQDFIDVNKIFFNALVQALDFSDPSSVNIINDWVKENTRGKIEEILDSISPADVMFLINAIYFKGTWTYEFDKELTREEFFNLPDGSQKTCQMMVQTGEFDYLENETFQAVDLPYGDGAFSMTIFLPKPGQNLDAIIDGLQPAQWSQWLQSFEKDSVTLEMPKFKLEYEDSLNKALINLGMGVAFAPGADFTRMYKPGGLFISYVKHKTFVEVNEEGTEAAAVTIVAIKESAGGDQHIKFMRVDRPYLFVIRENHTQTILFMGKIVSPEFKE
ncbi:MAG: serpin family protein [bacterium]